jgi:hypothetical protein
MDGVPQRPAAVPEGAVWESDAGEWRLGAVDERGSKQGLHRSWRADGTLREEVTFVDGKGEGRYRRFHPNGELACEGEFVGGGMQGTLRAYGCDAPTPELLQPCCVPPNAWQLQTDYDRGEMMSRRWYDRQGTQILENGEPHPPWPTTVPARAHFDEGAGLWVDGTYDLKASPIVHWRRWSVDGALIEEEDLEAGVRHGVWRRFRDDGALQFEGHYERGLRHGTFRDLAIRAQDYQPPGAASEEGAFAGDHAVGIWRLRDGAGALLAERDLGVACGDDQLARSPALADGDGARGAEAALRLAELARSLRGARRVGEAIIALARSAAMTGADGPLRELLAEATWPRSAAAGQDIATAAIDHAGERLAPLVDGIVRGGDAPALLRALASSIGGAHHAALDLVDAALLLAPERVACYVTRALVHVHLGAPDRACADARRLPEGWEEQRQLLVDYVRVIFPRFDFWPARTAIETLFEEYPAAPAQPANAIRKLAQKYATRLALIRAALVRAPGLDAGPSAPPVPSWLPPELPELLPEGPVPLGAWRFRQSLEPDAGAVDIAAAAGTLTEAETEEIAVDERLALDNQPLPSLLRWARRDWAALCWLCWSCGLDRVALPAVVTPPAEFGRAAGMAIERAWHCRDKLTSGGLVAMSKGVPGFAWEGVHIDVMPRALVEVMADEYIDLRALFCWLCDASAQSPWQSDLREDD